MAFVASFVDTVGFIALFSLFTAHVTGNFVVIAATLIGSGGGLKTKFLALPVFVLAVAAAQAIALSHPARPLRTARWLIAGQILFLLLFMSAGLAAWPLSSGDSPLAMAAGLTGVFAMGLQNALMRTPAFSSLPPTTVMTGNVTQITMDLTTLVLGSAAARPEARSRVAHTGLPILTFALGAAAAAIGFSLAGFWCLLAPVVLLGAVVFPASKDA